MIVAIIRPILLFALDQRYAPKGTSAASKDVDGLGGKVDALVGLFERADGRWGEVEDRVKELEIHSKNEWRRIGEQMAHTADTLDKATSRLAQIGDDHIRLMERWNLQRPPIHNSTGGAG